MTRVAFYAPLKPPGHPVPSGDRTMARSLIKALSSGGIKVDIACDFQSRDGKGDPEVQKEKMAHADALIPTLTAQGKAAGWQAWTTYHNYYKAPDLIGPKVSAALKIPYLLIEATRARKRLTGAWAQYAKAAEAATDAADIVFYLTQRDAEALRSYGRPRQKLVHLRPFLARENLPPLCSEKDGMLSVGMFRKGDKLASYQIIADTLALLKNSEWRLSIAGDGPAKDEVRHLMAPFGDKIIWLGALQEEPLAEAYAHHRLLLWPGFNEAFGMTYLEAQAAGMVVVAQDRPGVRDVLAPGLHRPDPEDGAPAIADLIDGFLSDPEKGRKDGENARHYIGSHHLISQARDTLCTHIKEVTQ